jgi:hypothetical protein
MDSDIPVAYAVPAYAASSAPYDDSHNRNNSSSYNYNSSYGNNSNNTYAPPMRPNLQHAQQANGRSSRVLLPSSQRHIPQLNDHQIDALLAQGYTRGLAEALHRNQLAFPMRIWIVDNSGSMTRMDGHRLAETKRHNDVKLVTCSRWSEMQQTVEYHAHMAALLHQPTVFRLLNDPGRVNGPQQFSIAEHGNDASLLDHELAVAHSTMMNTSPEGVTPLAEHLYEVQANVREMAPTLRRDGTKVVLVLATDGLPTNSEGWTTGEVKAEFVRALRGLEGLPVWIVVRLCTDEDDVVSFWNELDSQLEISLEVLDDFVAEGREVYAHNPWLTYGLPLHRMREMGYHDRLIDLLDERALSKDEVRDICRILLGRGLMDGCPDPQVDWSGFLDHVQDALKHEKATWNPLSKRMTAWVDVKRLRIDYGSGIMSMVKRCFGGMTSSSHTKRD